MNSHRGRAGFRTARKTRWRIAGVLWLRAVICGARFVSLQRKQACIVVIVRELCRNAHRSGARDACLNPPSLWHVTLRKDTCYDALTLPREY